MKSIMKRALSLWSVAVLTLCGVLALASEGMTTPVIDGVRLGVHQKGHTRVVLDMDSAPDFAVVPRNEGTPVVDIIVQRSAFAFDESKLPGSTGLVDRVSVDGGKLVIRLDDEALPVRSFVIPPNETADYYRLVFDLEPVSAAAFAEAVTDAEAKAAQEMAEKAPEPEPKQKTPPADLAELVEKTNELIPDDAEKKPEPVRKPLAAAKKMTRIPQLRPGRDDRNREVPVAAAEPKPEPKPKAEPVKTAKAEEPEKEANADSSDKIVIVLDPGHGGRDPGSIGSTGLEEKRVTWAMAKNIRDELTSRGYEVVFTREGDEYINLQDRIDFARNRQADMFVSIHADSNPVPSVRGASVYTLSEDRSEKLAQEVTGSGDFKLFDRELSAEDREVSSILYDLANTDTKNKSDRLASSLITHMTGRVRMVNNTHREAGLVVLLSPDVPAVLVELAFMSNSQDEANLGSRTWRKNTASAIADGIDGYFALGRRAGSYPITTVGN